MSGPPMWEEFRWGYCCPKHGPRLGEALVRLGDHAFCAQCLGEFLAQHLPPLEFRSPPMPLVADTRQGEEGEC